MGSVTERTGALREQVQADPGVPQPPRIVREADHRTRTVSPPAPDADRVSHVPRRDAGAAGRPRQGAIARTGAEGE